MDFTVPYISYEVTEISHDRFALGFSLNISQNLSGYCMYIVETVAVY